LRRQMGSCSLEKKEKKTPWASPGRLFSVNANSGACYLWEDLGVNSYI
jgi:hypothetical protein